jgi:hypothetical protein
VQILFPCALPLPNHAAHLSARIPRSFPMVCRNILAPQSSFSFLVNILHLPKYRCHAALGSTPGVSLNSHACVSRRPLMRWPPRVFCMAPTRNASSHMAHAHVSLPLVQRGHRLLQPIVDRLPFLLSNICPLFFMRTLKNTSWQ